MEFEARVSEQPFLDLGGLVGAVVVKDQMHAQLRRHLLIHVLQELLELSGSVAAVGLLHHLATGQVEGGEESGGAMTLVVMRASLRQPRSHGQAGLGSIQGLDLTFRAPRGAMGTERPEMVAIGLSRQADEAEGSLTLGTQERAGAALTTRGRAQTSGPPGPSKRDREVGQERNQRFKAPSRSAGSKPGGYGPERDARPRSGNSEAV